MLLTIITGPMFSGKSEELLRRINRLKHARKKIIAFKSPTDSRDKNFIKSRYITIGFPATQVTNDQYHSILKKVDGFSVVFFDEIQFFSEDIIEIIDKLILEGKEVVVSGLDMDFTKSPFLVTATLMAMADKVIKLSGICHKCKGNSIFTQLIINQKPILTKNKGNIVIDDGTVTYETRCRNCFGK